MSQFAEGGSSRPLGSVSMDEFFSDGGGGVPETLQTSKLVALPDDVLQIAESMISGVVPSERTPKRGPFTPQPVTNNVEATQQHQLTVPPDVEFDVDLFQLAVGKDVLSVIDDTISHHSAIIDKLNECKNNMCKVLNIKGDDE